MNEHSDDAARQAAPDTDARLRESEARMRFALAAGRLGMWEWDREHDSWVWNERWAEMRGYGHDQVQPRYDDWHPDDEARLRPTRDAFMQGRISSYEVEYRVRHRDGSWRWINSRTLALRHAPDGQPLCMVGVQSDIHDRRLSEDQARANLRWLQLAVDATDLGLWDWDAATDRMTWSPRCAQMLDCAPEDMPATATAWRAICDDEDYPAAHEVFVDHLRGRTPAFRFEARVVTRDGRCVWIENTGRVVARDPHGRALRCVGTQRDISEIKQAELALRESEARLRTVVENSPFGIFLADPDGAVAYLNPARLALEYGQRPEALGHAWMDYVHPEDRERVVTLWRAFVAAPSGVHDVTWRAVLADGVELQLRSRTAAVREGDRVLGFVGTLEDITEQQAAAARERALQNQLQRSQKIEAIGTLTAGIAHDFNNSLATILGFATLARSREQLDAKLDNYLATIVAAAEHSRDLVRKLLEFSRSAPGGAVAPLDAATRIAEAAHMLKAVIPATIRIETDIARGVAPVLMDATDFQQMLVNLVLNARDAIAGHGVITLGLRAPRTVCGHCAGCLRDIDGDYVELTVHDTGCGIRAEELPRIFDPFYSTKEVGQGTGMGLAVLHGIVHRADGHVMVESTPGQGTRMRVLLRAAVATAQGAVAQVAPTAVGSARPLRALVVDDEPAIVRFLEEWLDAEGCVAIAFSDPLAARDWALSDEARFDLLITDQTMPGLTGLELAQALRERHPELPVLVCTGLADRVAAAHGHALDRMELLLKPVPLDELRAALLRATHRA